jgi:ubiquinone/menaquinone biosynthesis C-methylase UbiE
MTTHAPADDVKTFFDGVAEQLQEGKLSYVPFTDPRRDAQIVILSRAFVRSLRRWVASGSLILDVGCGHGALLEDAVAQYRMVGVDFVAEMLPLARQRGYTVYHGDALSLPFDGDQFDAVVCAEVLQHFPDPALLLAELARVCQPGGTILLSTLNRRSFVRFITRRLGGIFHSGGHALPIVRRAVADVVDVATTLRLDVVEVAWVLSPSSVVAFSRLADSPLAPLATNFILCLRKPPAGV